MRYGDVLVGDLPFGSSIAPNEHAHPAPKSPPLAAAAVPAQEPYPREIYSVDGNRVTHDTRSGWQCECQAFTQARECEHVGKALALQNLRQSRPKSP
jgi:hypothetical protein